MMDPTKSDEMYEKINHLLIIYLERFARALSRIFTLGELHEKAQTNYAYISDFLNIMNDQLGKSVY